MGEPMLTEEQANKLKQLADNVTKAKVLLVTETGSSNFMLKVVAVTAEGAEKEFDEYLATLTMKE